jgi:hypothetical protein
MSGSGSGLVGSLLVDLGVVEGTHCVGPGVEVVRIVDHDAGPIERLGHAGTVRCDDWDAGAHRFYCDETVGLAQ